MTEEDMDTRLASPLAFPDSVIFKNAMDSQDPGHLPDPLMVTAWLGDHVTMEQIRKQMPASVDFLAARKLAVYNPMDIEPKLSTITTTPCRY